MTAPVRHWNRADLLMALTMAEVVSVTPWLERVSLSYGPAMQECCELIAKKWPSLRPCEQWDRFLAKRPQNWKLSADIPLAKNDAPMNKQENA